MNDCTKGTEIRFEEKSLVRSLYRPFVPSWVYFHPRVNDQVYQIPKLFPTVSSENLAICVTGVGNKAFSCLLTNRIIDLNALEAGTQCFPRYIYKLAANSQQYSEGDLFSGEGESVPIDGFVKEDAITDEALKYLKEAYPGNSINKDDLFYYIYGILHSEDYRTKYANNLSKELPRIPRVASYEQFKAFADAGKKLADLHVNFEKQPRYKGVKVQKREGCSFRVTQMKWGKIAGKTGNAAKDKTRLFITKTLRLRIFPWKRRNM